MKYFLSFMLIVVVLSVVFYDFTTVQLIYLGAAGLIIPLILVGVFLLFNLMEFIKFLFNIDSED